MTTGSRAVAVARSQNGVRERGFSNRVKFNTWYYGRSVSGSAYPWCAAFTSWVYDQIGLKAGRDFPRSASVAMCFEWYRKHGRRIDKRKLRPGDQVRYTFSHTGIFAGYRGGRALVWEGNTSASTRGSQRDGGGVHLRTRSLSLIQYGGRPKFHDAPRHATKTPPKPSPRKSTQKEGDIMPVIATGTNTSKRTIKPGQTTRIRVGEYFSMTSLRKGQQVRPTVEIGVAGAGSLAVSAKIVDFLKGGKPQDRIVGNFFEQDFASNRSAKHVYTPQSYVVKQTPRKGASLRLQLQVTNRGKEPVVITSTNFTVEGRDA